MKVKVIQFTALFLLMLVTGVFWGTWFALSRSIEVFSIAEFVHIGKTIIENLAMPMRFIMPGCILFMILSTWYYPDRRAGGFYFAIAAVLLIIAALLITLLVEVPIDNQIKQWTAMTTPPDWEAIRDRWNVFHFARTIISLLSFACFAVAVMFRNDYKDYA